MFATRAAKGARFAAQPTGIELAVRLRRWSTASAVVTPGWCRRVACRRGLARQRAAPRPRHLLRQDQFSQPVRQSPVAGTEYFARYLQHETHHIKGVVMEIGCKSRPADSYARTTASVP